MEADMCSQSSTSQGANPEVEKRGKRTRRKYRRRADSLIFKLSQWPILCDDKTELWDGIACLPYKPLSRTQFVIVDRLYNSDREGVAQWMRDVWEQQGVWRTAQIYLALPPDPTHRTQIIGVGEKYEDLGLPGPANNDDDSD